MLATFDQTKKAMGFCKLKRAFSEIRTSLSIANHHFLELLPCELWADAEAVGNVEEVDEEIEAEDSESLDIVDDSVDVDSAGAEIC